MIDDFLSTRNDLERFTPLFLFPLVGRWCYACQNQWRGGNSKCMVAWNRVDQYHSSQLTSIMVWFKLFSPQIECWTRLNMTSHVFVYWYEVLKHTHLPIFISAVSHSLWFSVPKLDQIGCSPSACSLSDEIILWDLWEHSQGYQAASPFSHFLTHPAMRDDGQQQWQLVFDHAIFQCPSIGDVQASDVVKP